MKSIITGLLLILFGSSPMVENGPQIRFEGLKIWVTDLDKAKAFYEGILGFEMEMTSKSRALLKTGSFPIHIGKAKLLNETDYEKHERTGLSLQVYKLLPAIDDLRKKGVDLLDLQLQRNGVGISIPFKDPFGNLLSLMEVQIREVPQFEGYQIYNTGITSSDMDKSIAFYKDLLGFEEWSRNYLPQAMPLKHNDGSFAFMLHYKPNLMKRDRELGKGSEINLLFSTSDLDTTIKSLEVKGIQFVKRSAKEAAFVDPFGNICELIEK